MTEDWYGGGYEGAEEERTRRETQKKTPWRFFIKAGQSCKIIFLDDFSKTRKVQLKNGERVERSIVPFTFDEHHVTFDGDWRGYFTCLRKNNPPCPLCSRGDRSYFIGMFTVLASWTDDAGNEKWGKRLLPAKLETVERIRRKAARQNGQLQFCKFEVFRSTKKAATVGDEFELIKQMTKAEVTALLPEGVDLEPVPYMEAFKPISRADMDAFIQAGRIQIKTKNGSGGTGGSAGNSNDGEQEESGDGKPAPDGDIPF